MALNQTNRLIRMTTGPLGPDEVVVTSLTGREAISRPFSFEVEFISTRLDLKPHDLIGAAVTLELDRRDAQAQPLPPRFVHGYVSRFAAGNVGLKEAGEHKFRQYRAELVPWLWFLTQTARCYLFFPEKEDKSIFEVIEAVISRAGADLHVDPAADLAGIGELAQRKVKHCVQYRETDFNFLSRTLEQYGVFYYFKFASGQHTLVLELKKNYPVGVEAEVSYPRVIGAQPTGDHITSWQHDYEFVPGKWTHTDYNYETPATSLSTSAPRLPSVDVPQADHYEVYDYPGGYALKPDGEKEARVRQEERELPHNSVEGASTCRTFTPGYTFTLVGHPDDEVVSEQGQSYLVTSVEHVARQPSDAPGEGAPASYRNRFSCILATVQYRPARRTPRPVISGVQTAVVVGPKGNELYTDPQGRVKVQFHWDRVGQKDQNTSCWIRVAQMWAGKGWGSVSTPRIGHEVIVEFLEGDPDQPIVTGSVHNADNKPPHTGVVSGLKSQTHKGSGSNQMTMDDTAGKEKVTIHAQHDMDTTVEHNQTNTVNNDLTETVKKNATISITEGNLSHDVKAGIAEYHVQGTLLERYDTTQTTVVKNDITIVCTGGPIAVASDAAHVYIKGTTSIQLHVGKSTLWMDSGGQIAIAGVNISLTGENVSINGKSSVTLKGGVVHSEAVGQHQTSGGIVLSESKGNNTLKGAMVLLNP